MCNKQLLDWNCGAEMLKMVVKLIFSRLSLCRSAFPTLPFESQKDCLPLPT